MPDESVSTDSISPRSRQFTLQFVFGTFWEQSIRSAAPEIAPAPVPELGKASPVDITRKNSYVMALSSPDADESCEIDIEGESVTETHHRPQEGEPQG